MAGKSRAQVEKDKENQLRAKQKLEDEKRAKEEALLLKPVQTQKVPPGVDPKTVLCAFFKAGHCEKGTKCKFSHDLNVGRKVDKKNLYEDTREEKLKGAHDVRYILTVTSRELLNRRHDGHMGRREVTQCCALKTWKSSYHDRRTHFVPCDSFITLSRSNRRLCASFSSKLLSLESMFYAMPYRSSHPLTRHFLKVRLVLGMSER